MKDLIDSIRLQVYERMSSPLFGSFVIAWIGWNHRLLAVLFSSLPIKERFEFIDLRLYASGWDAWSKGFVYPLLSTVAFILLYPYPAKFFYGYWQTRQRELKALRDKIEGDTLLTMAESQEIRLMLLKAKTEYRETIRQHVEEIEALKKVIENSARPSKPKSDSTSSPPKVTLSEGATAAIEVIARSEDGTIEKHKFIKSFPKSSPVRVQSHLDELLKLNLVHETRQNGIDFIDLTSTGRALAVKANFA